MVVMTCDDQASSAEGCWGAGDDELTHVEETYQIVTKHRLTSVQGPFQEPKLEVTTIYKAYVRGYTPKIWPQKKWCFCTSIFGSWNSH